MKKTLLSSVALATMLAFSPAFAGTVQLSAEQMDVVTAGNGVKHKHGHHHAPGLKINQKAVATATAEGGECTGNCGFKIIAPHGTVTIEDSNIATGASAIANAAASNVVLLGKGKGKGKF